MEVLAQRAAFVRKYASSWDWDALSANKSAGQELRSRTKELPWITDTTTTTDYHASYKTTIGVVGAEYHWTIIQALHNPFWNWETFDEATLEKMLNHSNMCNRFFKVWSNNPCLFSCNEVGVLKSFKRYIAAIRIQRVWKRCVSDPYHPIGRQRLLHEFKYLQ